jgi:adenine phosphoribosyltransferase
VQIAELQRLIRTIPDFPIPGIQFRDITPLIKDPEGFRATIELFVDRFKNERIDVVVGVEARGYILAAPLAYELDAGFVPVRKPGKLPGTKVTEEYALEYGTNSLEVHADAVGRGKRVLIVRLGAEIVEFAFLIELEALAGRKALGRHSVTAFMKY